ncbi:MAG TPA: nucleotide exchange factor GrpE [Casimicrobiaceae bacterium]|nr:nucleotide exchange factor GrpE [Casimicrobiaceae bacterium]
MGENPDNNSQVSGEVEAGVPIPTGAPANGPARPGDPAPDLATLLKQAEDEASRLKDAWLRAMAETDNVRKLAQNDVTKAHKYAIERFAQELLAVKDALEQTLAAPAASIEALKDGVLLTLKNLNAAFDKAQIAAVDPLHEKYDPHRHQAMTMIESDQPAGTVAQVFQKGYMLGDRVLRPALVAVAKPKERGETG